MYSCLGNSLVGSHWTVSLGWKHYQSNTKKYCAKVTVFEGIRANDFDLNRFAKNNHSNRFMNKNRFRRMIRSVWSQVYKQCPAESNVQLIIFFLNAWYNPTDRRNIMNQMSVNHHNTPEHRCSRADSIWGL